VQILTFGVSLIVFMIFMPQGISGLMANWRTALKSRKTGALKKGA
jgi:ABC-type branched-subunit amino acid transport system permease subunit